jgi:hypothetical protein
MTRTSTKGIHCLYSIVNWMKFLRVLRWMKKSCNTSELCCQTNVIYTLQPQWWLVLCWVSFLKCCMKMLEDRELPITMPSFWWTYSPPESWWFTNFQQFHDGFNLQERLLNLCMIAMEHIYDDLQGIIDWYVNERLTRNKLTSVSSLKVYRFQ